MSSAENTAKLRRFEGKSVIITGAAGNLGSTMARCFAEEGARLVLCAHATTEHKLKELIAELQSLGSPASIYAIFDVSNLEDVKKCVKLAVEKFGGIDILVNNAAHNTQLVAALDSVVETDEEDFKRTQDVNVYGVFLMMKYVAKEMIKAGKGGVIINISSISGLHGSPYFFSYTTSKFAVNGMTRAAAKSLGTHKIRVNAVAPFILEGRMVNEFFKALTIKGMKSVSV